MVYVVYIVDVLVLGFFYVSKIVVYDKNDFNFIGYGVNGNCCYFYYVYLRIWIKYYFLVVRRVGVELMLFIVFFWCVV